MRVVYVRLVDGWQDYFDDSDPGVRVFYTRESQSRQFRDIWTDPTLFRLPNGRWIFRDTIPPVPAREITAIEARATFVESDCFEWVGGQEWDGEGPPPIRHHDFDFPMDCIIDLGYQFEWLIHVNLGDEVLKPISTTAPRPDFEEKKQSKNDDRDAWIYDEYVKGESLAAIVDKLRDLANVHGWKAIPDRSGIPRAAKRFANRHAPAVTTA